MSDDSRLSDAKEDNEEARDAYTYASGADIPLFWLDGGMGSMVYGGGGSRNYSYRVAASLHC